MFSCPCVSSKLYAGKLLHWVPRPGKDLKSAIFLWVLLIHQDICVQRMTTEAPICVPAVQEINLMEKLSFDRNIVQFYGAVLSGTAPMLILEYMEGDVPSLP